MKPRQLLHFNFARMLVWLVQIPVALLTPLKDSVPYLVFLSLAALVEGAFSAYVASRAEVMSAENPPPGDTHA